MTPIFIMGHARSGSTLLQRLLNSVPGVRIYGEHGGSLHQIAAAYKGFCKDLCGRHWADALESVVEEKLSDPNYWGAKVAGFKVERIRELTRLYIYAVGNPFNRTDVRWGFKEVRYGIDAHVTDMLLELVPGCQIVFTVRPSPFDYCDSMKALGWLRDVERTALNWKRQRDHFTTSARINARTTVVNHGADEVDYVRLFDWLGLTWTPTQSAILHAKPVGAAPKKNLLTPEEIAAIRRVTEMEPLIGSDPMTSSLPTTRSTN